MPLMNFTQYAAHRGVSKMAVSFAVRDGRISTITDPRTGKRLIDPAVADQEWKRNTSDERKPLAKRAEDDAAGAEQFEQADEPVDLAPAQGQQPPAPAGAMPSAASSLGRKKVPPLAESRAFKEAFQARLAQVEYDLKTGRLVEADKVKEQAYKVARILRDAVMAVPDRIDAELAGLSDRGKVNLLLKDELRKALEELTDAG